VRAHIGLLDDPPSLAEDGGGDEDLLADHGVVLVVRVVGVVELAVGAELMPELALVPHVVPKVELSITHSAAVLAAAHRHRFLFFLSSSPLSVRVDSVLRSRLIMLRIAGATTVSFIAEGFSGSA
jgi:hypothetical protein